MTLEKFRHDLNKGNEARRAYLLSKLMRQARPDDVFIFVTPARMRADWLEVERNLGKSREFRRWLLDKWEEQGVA